MENWVEQQGVTRRKEEEKEEKKVCGNVSVLFQRSCPTQTE